MAGITAAGTLAALALGQPRAAGGFALGALIAILGYSWLHQAVVGIMNQGGRRPSRILPGKLLVRYPVAVIAVFIFYRERWLPFEAVLAGLFIPAAGAVAESLYQISAAFRHSKAT
jgi:ATP synthase I chain